MAEQYFKLTKSELQHFHLNDFEFDIWGKKNKKIIKKQIFNLTES